MMVVVKLCTMSSIMWYLCPIALMYGHVVLSYECRKLLKEALMLAI